LYRVWQWRWNKTWKEGFAGIGTFISGLFLAIIGYCEVAISKQYGYNLLVKFLFEPGSYGRGKFICSRLQQ